MTTIVDAAAAVPRPIAVGPEMAALARFYPDVTWTGTVAADGMGPGTPEMTAIGRASHRFIQDGRWIVATCSQEQYLLDGTFVLTWQLHLVVGWDPSHGDYRATIADNYGHAVLMRGRIDRDRLVFETVDDATVRLRMTWDASDPRNLKWRNESSLDGKAWTLIETYRMTPTAPWSRNSTDVAVEWGVVPHGPAYRGRSQHAVARRCRLASGHRSPSRPRQGPVATLAGPTGPRPDPARDRVPPAP